MTREIHVELAPSSAEAVVCSCTDVPIVPGAPATSALLAAWVWDGWAAEVEAVLSEQAPVGIDLLAVLLDRPRHEVVPLLDRHPLIYLDGNRRWSIAKAAPPVRFTAKEVAHAPAPLGVLVTCPNCGSVRREPPYTARKIERRLRRARCDACAVWAHTLRSIARRAALTNEERQRFQLWWLETHSDETIAEIASGLTGRVCSAADIARARAGLSLAGRETRAKAAA